MWHLVIRPFALCALLLLANPALADDPFAQSAEDAAAAAADYHRYCSLCHGDDRQGYAHDEAPSLRSESLMRSGYPTHLLYAVAYGRRGTPMGGYFEEIGGPMSREELYRLLRWLHDQVGVEPIELSLEPVTGDIALGEEIYADNCAVCHGENGEGEIGPAIGNPAMLSLNTDAFLRYAVENGRDDTAMPAFADTLSSDEIDAVTAFLRSRATGWTVEKPVLRTPPIQRPIHHQSRLALARVRITRWRVREIRGSVQGITGKTADGVARYPGNFDVADGAYRRLRAHSLLSR